MKLNKFFIIVVLIFIILLSTFYSEGMSAYVMKNAFINTDNNAGRLTTIDTDGNFSNVVSDVNTVQKNNSKSTDINKVLSGLSNNSSDNLSINIDSNVIKDIESKIVDYINNNPDVVNKIEKVFSESQQKTTTPK